MTLIPHVRCALCRLTKPACPAQSCATECETRHPGPPNLLGGSSVTVPATVAGSESVDFDRHPRTRGGGGGPPGRC
jgi:hypothetical protein